jgi:hypothetical protein
MSTQAKKPDLISNQEVDRQVNAVFTAYLRDLGNPSFTAGACRNIRDVVTGWDPLAQDLSLLYVSDFRESYLPAHFFDRYFYTAELDQKTLEAEAEESFSANCALGWAYEVILGVNEDVGLRDVFAEASLIVHRCLGELELDEIFGRCTHGPNSTVGVQRKDAFLDKKVLDVSGTKGALYAFYEYLKWDKTLDGMLAEAANGTGLGENPRVSDVGSVPGNILSFVPKKWNKLRSMSKEGSLNQFFQLGTGGVIQDRLKRWCNIDLKTQAASHRLLAKLASKYPEIGCATVDWSQASDRIWIEVIRRLVPEDWFQWLCLIRSPASFIVDKKGNPVKGYELPMIGTMGNGFVFPLQTLVFYALLVALARRRGIDEIDISVFGDDCYVPCDLIEDVQWLAEKLGWQLNVEKSHWDGRFRESCGLDAYMGTDVRPFFIERPASRKDVNALKAWSYVVYNGIRRALTQESDPAFVKDRFTHVWRWLLDFHEKFDLGMVLLVPPRFSDASGVRLYDIANAPTDGCMLPTRDGQGGVLFRYLRNLPTERAIHWDNPWYWQVLAGRPEPRQFQRWDYLECDNVHSGVNDAWLKSNTKRLAVLEKGGDPREARRRVPRKEVRYGSVKGYVYTWDYWISQ